MPAHIARDKPRHLVFLLDGTWVSASAKTVVEHPSNIYKLNLFLETTNVDDEPQITFYIPGIGSKSRGSGFFNKYIGGADAAEIARDIEFIYTNICSNYIETDKIYIFGFSRGAVVARLVASIIAKFGVLKASQLSLYPSIMSHITGGRKICDIESFRDQSSHNAYVEFLGVFDTVLGQYMGDYASGLKKLLFADRKLPDRVRRAVHIVALNETRNLFRPVLFRDVSGGTQHLKQIWMPGVHTDVGGGYRENFLSKVSLLTMINELLHPHTELKIDSTRLRDLQASIVSDANNCNITIHNESIPFRSIWWWLDLFKGGGRRRQIDMSDAKQWMHPICDYMDKRFVEMVPQENAVQFMAPDWNQHGLDYADVALLQDCLFQPLDDVN
jgi:uncharacterized protein (DUF2235 family)